MANAEQRHDIGAAPRQVIVLAQRKGIIDVVVVVAEHAPVADHNGVAKGHDAGACRIA